MAFETVDSVLEHFGVKGMKWGVRRSKKQLAKAAKSQGRSVKDMSDAELRTAVNRMNMEQQYTRLSSGGGSNRNRNLVAAGGAFAASIALNVARQQIQNQANARIAAAIATRAAARAARRAAGG